MDQTIVKMVVLMKTSYPKKNIFGLLANIRAFMKVATLKNTGILEYYLVDSNTGPQQVVSGMK